MPVEIGELVSRVTILEPHAGGDTKGPAMGAGASTGQDALVQECVRQVLQILRKERER